MIKRERKTSETVVSVCLLKQTYISTGLPFFDHMLEQVSFYSGLSMEILAQGDLAVDSHHLVEDTGIVLGEALAELIREHTGFARYGHIVLPMDDALVGVAIDLSGRAYAACSLNLANTVRDFSEECVREFLWGLARGAKLTIHVYKLSGLGDHHIIEAVFKGLGRTLRQALEPVGEGLPSTKGVL